MGLQKTSPVEIIRHSIRVFRRKGYYRASMADLARETGLTKGAFYHHFESKEEVMKKALQASTLWFKRKIFSLADEVTKSPKERLQAMADLSYRAFTDDAGGCFFANTILETAHVEDTFLGEIKQFFGLWEKALRDIFKERYQGDDLEETVQQVIADIEGSIVLMQLHQDHAYLERALKRSVEKA